MISVTHMLPFSGVGGTEQMVLNLCKFRDQAEFDCVVAMPEDGVMAQEIRNTGTPVYIGELSYHAAMRRADIVNLHWMSYDPNWHGVAKSSGKPYVTTLHWASEMPELPTITICTSLYTYQMQKDKSQFEAIPNGIDLSRFVPRPKIQKEEVIITRVCRPTRCALYFWMGMREVLDRYPQTRLWVVGNEDGPGQSSDRMHFLGIRRDVPDILARSDIFAYTPYPNAGSKDLVAMEASAMGVPCVVSDVTCMRESIEQGQNGFLTPFGDVEAFVEKIGMLVEDASLRDRMGQAAIRIAQEQFDMRRITRRYEAVYRAVLDAW